MKRGQCTNCRELECPPNPDIPSVYVTLLAASGINIEDRRHGVSHIALYAKYSFAAASPDLRISPETSAALGLDPTKPADYVKKIEASEEYKAREKELAAMQLRMHLLKRQFDYEQNRPL